MFPNPRQLHDLLRLIRITDIGKRRGHLLRLDEEMRRRDGVVLFVRGVGDLLEREFAVVGVRAAVEVCVADGVVGDDELGSPEGESEGADLEEAEQVHGLLGSMVGILWNKLIVSRGCRSCKEASTMYSNLLSAAHALFS